MLSVHVTVSEIDHAQCFLTHVPEDNQLMYWGYISDTFMEKRIQARTFF